MVDGLLDAPEAVRNILFVNMRDVHRFLKTRLMENFNFDCFAVQGKAATRYKKAYNLWISQDEDIMSILSIQSHVAYGYVGNKAAVYPLQAMGHDVWPVHTVQFSNHTGYGKWQGEIFEAAHIQSVVKGIEDIGQAEACRAILSGYMGSRAICEAVAAIVQRFKARDPSVLYLCDPVIGNTNCFVKPEVLDFYKKHLAADIITPNQFEAETLSGRAITDRKSLRDAAAHFHDLGVQIVVVTGVKLTDFDANMGVYLSEKGSETLIPTQEVAFSTPVNGTGDLFSAVFLGHYLMQRDAVQALSYATQKLHEVLLNTQKAQTRELQVLSAKYGL